MLTNRFNIKQSENINQVDCIEEARKTRNWSVKMAESVLIKPIGNPNSWSYEHGVVSKGMEAVWRKTGDIRYFNAIKQLMDNLVDENGIIKNYRLEDFNIDFINNGKVLLMLYKETGEEKYKKAIDTLKEQLKQHPKTSENVFWHKKIYEYQIWLDGLYMEAPFNAEYIKEFEDEKDFEEVIDQFLVSYRHLKDDCTGLLYHAWDEMKQQPWCNPQTGLSKNFWGRAMGWYVMAIVDVLDYIPEDYQSRGALIEMLESLMIALKKVRDEESKVWYQVLDEPNRKGNYLEASVSTMVVYAMAKAVRKGYLDISWKQVAEESYQGIIDEFITVMEDGLVKLNKNCAVAGLGGEGKRDGSFEYYISEPIVANDGKGVGAFLLASCEIEMM